MNPLIFREYDVRGIVGTDLTGETVETLGRAFGTFLRRRGRDRATLGHDCRTSSAPFGDALARGMTSCGVDVTHVGTVPTPLVYWSMFALDVDSAAMVTGSHNPKEFNGFKLCLGRTSVHGEDVQELRRIAVAGGFERGAGRLGRADVVPSYLDRVAGDARIGARRLRVVVDAGNGTGGVVALPLLARLGIDAIPLYCDMDGEFPNHHPDPTVPENLAALRREVVERGADLGIAFDGDADRLGVVTERGDVVHGDMVLLVLARALLREVPGAEIVSEVKCSQVLFDEIAKAGGRPLMWRVGHSLIKAKMAEDDAALGGEMSGHIFFRHRWYGFDDAIYSAVRLLEVLSAHDGPASSLLAGLPQTWVTPEIRVDCPDELKWDVVAIVREALKARGLDVVEVDGARAKFTDGWGLVRASNTQPVLVSRFEAASPEALARIRADVFAEIDRAKSAAEGVKT
ncbi:MAG: phosphomannomutase/phosphoglucomutase [Deltaproteobacteria bacterium]|nr:phosphomannomutase/phosphoglucomutase [Deltaproteobacteria bacterium]